MHGLASDGGGNRDVEEEQPAKSGDKDWKEEPKKKKEKKRMRTESFYSSSWLVDLRF